MTPRFLTVEEVVEIQLDQVERYGGSGGVLDWNLLKSAIGMPEAGFGEQYLHADLFEMAAAYLFHLVQNYPFADGNKRVGAAAALVFLEMNGVDLDVPENALVETVLSVAQGQIGKAAVSEFFRKHAKE